MHTYVYTWWQPIHKMAVWKLHKLYEVAWSMYVCGMMLWAKLAEQLSPQYHATYYSLFMHVYLLEWAGYHFSVRTVTPLEVRGEGIYRVNWLTICKRWFATGFTRRSIHFRYSCAILGYAFKIVFWVSMYSFHIQLLVLSPYCCELLIIRMYVCTYIAQVGALSCTLNFWNIRRHGSDIYLGMSPILNGGSYLMY